MCDPEDVAMEDALFPWLASDCMSDANCGEHEEYDEEFELECLDCGEPISEEEDYCPECVQNHLGIDRRVRSEG